MKTDRLWIGMYLESSLLGTSPFRTNRTGKTEEVVIVVFVLLISFVHLFWVPWTKQRNSIHEPYNTESIVITSANVYINTLLLRFSEEEELSSTTQTYNVPDLT